MKGHIESLLTDDDLDVLTVEIKLPTVRSDLERKNKIIPTPCRIVEFIVKACQIIQKSSEMNLCISTHFVI